MNIAGLVVFARPERIDSVRRQLIAIPGVEVHAAADNGRLVITVEEHRDASVVSTMGRLHELDGVLAAALVYHYGDDESENVQEVRHNETDAA
jgi:periplasmic nitrate reductase NapD